MVKEGEGGVTSPSKGRSGLQRMTGQGKETEGIKYPVPSINIMAVLEQEYGPLEQLKDPGVNVLRMMIFLLEMQKVGKEEEVEMMTTEERRLAAAKLVREKDINVENFRDYADATNQVFTRALRLKRRR